VATTESALQSLFVFRSLVPPPLPVTGNPLEGDKPRHRGRLHQLAFFVSIPAGLALFAIAAHSTPARVVAAIYGLSVTALYATSALYNRLLGTDRLRPWMRWLDHAMIYVLIAGSYTPVCWAVLSTNWRTAMLTGIWFAALTGIVIKMSPLKRFRRVGGGLYFVMGWLALLVLPQLLHGLTGPARVLLIGGGVFYMFGAILLRLQRPNPSASFGYHEVWHAFVVAAGMCHFAMNWLALSHM
jgi:hemolysin III